MGIFNRKSHDDDLAGDVRTQYMDALRRGKDGTEATRQLIAEYEPAWLDEEDAPRFWLALAESQWDVGRLEETVKRHALACIEEALAYAQTKADDAACTGIPINALTALKQKLLSPQPQQKKIQPYRLYHTDWKMGDVFAYCLDGEGAGYPDFHNRYVYFVVKGTETWYPGHTIPVVYVYWAASEALLRLDELRQQAYLPQFYTPTAYRNNPGMKPQYALGLLCTSARVIPQKKLKYLGNIGSIRAIEKEEPHVYQVAWKRFDRYMIENYMAWENNTLEP